MEHIYAALCVCGLIESVFGENLRRMWVWQEKCRDVIAHCALNKSTFLFSQILITVNHN